MTAASFRSRDDQSFVEDAVENVDESGRASVPSVSGVGIVRKRSWIGAPRLHPRVPALRKWRDRAYLSNAGANAVLLAFPQGRI